DASGHRYLRDGDEFESRFRHEPGLQSLGRPEHHDARIRILEPDVVGDRQQRRHVTGGASTGEQNGQGHERPPDRRAGMERGRRRRRGTVSASAAPGSCRAKASTIPAAMRFATSAEPPYDTYGSGTPMTGSSFTTTATFTTA